jgi:hypothetical protein
MLRKTAAIAVLILLISSFTLGSTGRIQAVSGAGSDKGTVTFVNAGRGMAGLPFMAAAGGERVFHGAGEAGKVALSQGVPDTVPDFSTGIAFVTTAGDQMTSGIINEGAPLSELDGNYSSIILYTDDLRLEQPTMSAFMLSGPGNWMPTAGAIAIPVRMPEKQGFDNLTITGNLALTKPGGEPQFMEFQWHKDRTAGDNGTFARFTGHMSIAGSNLTFSRMMLPPGATFDPATGVIEINSSMMVDMDQLKKAVTANEENGTYNNHIAAGQTNWHSASVSEAVKSLNVDLKWSNPDGKLRLMVYTPDGKVLGPYYDDSDGKTDGRINLNIANPSGVASGEWHLKVTDIDDMGSDDYYVKTY